MSQVQVLKVAAQFTVFSCDIVCIYLPAAVMHSCIFCSILRYVNIGLLCNSALFFPRQTHMYISNINVRTLAFYANGMLRGCCSFYCVTPMFCGCKWAFMLQKHVTHLRDEHVWHGEWAAREWKLVWCLRRPVQSSVVVSNPIDTFSPSM